MRFIKQLLYLTAYAAAFVTAWGMYGIGQNVLVQDLPATHFEIVWFFRGLGGVMFSTTAISLFFPSECNVKDSWQIFLYRLVIVGSASMIAVTFFITL
jgi:hypothetical protein